MPRIVKDKKGMEDVLALIELIRNPDVFKNAVEELIKLHDDAEAMVESVGPAKEIMSIRSQCDSDRMEAKALIETAKVKAKKLTADAAAKIKKSQDDVAAKLVDVDAKAKKLSAEAGAKTIALDARERSVGAREKMAANRMVKGEALLRKGKELKAEFEAKLKKMKDL